jgi:hypothetical protein
MKKSIFIGIAFSLSSIAFAQKPINASDFGESINPKDLYKHLSVLASDDYQGRETGQKGQKAAANYIANEFDRLRLTPAGNDRFFQTFGLIKKTLAARKFIVNQQQFNYGDDFFCAKNISNVNFQSNEIVFAGYGIIDKKRNDFKDYYIEGKVVVILAGEPKNKKGLYLLSNSKEKSEWSSKNKKIAAIQKLKPKAILIIDADYAKFAKKYKHQMETPSMGLAETLKKEPEVASKEKAVNDCPVITINDSVATALLLPNNKNIAKLRSKYSKRRSIDPFVLKSTLAANIVFLEESLNSENVIAYIPGSERPNEFVYITAHYDHIGVIDNEVYNGADDDGSGTVGVLEIAEAFALARDQGQGPKRSIVFMTVAGEEKGLLGSEFYTSNPTFPINNSVCDLNIDMIGRVDDAHKKDSNYIYVIGSDKISSDLHEINEKMNTAYTHMNLDYTFNSPSDPNRFYYRSDHYNFAKYNIPIIFYFNGVHEDYHKATDEIAKINFGMLSNRTKLVFYTAWEISNRAEPLRKDKKNDFENNR